MRSALAVLASLLAASPLWAGEPGTAGATFLKLGAGARAVGMGEANTAVADDAYAAYWNPGGLSQLRYPELVFSHNQHLEGVNQQFVSYAHPLLGGTVLGANLTRLAVGSFDAYDNAGGRNGSVSADDLAVGLSIARGFTLAGPGAPFFGAGASVKHVRERLASASASTFAMDLGLITRDWERWLGSWARGARLGFAMRHIGPGMRFVSETTRLPTTAAVGLSMERTLWKDPFIASVEYSRPNDSQGAVSIGGEYWLNQMVAARVGYCSGLDEGLGLRFGVGLRLKKLQIDYAFSGYGDLGNTHRIGLTLRFAAPTSAPKGPDETLRTAQSLMAQDRHYEAILELNRVLDQDPGNERAVELLRKVKQELQQGGDKDGR